MKLSNIITLIKADIFRTEILERLARLEHEQWMGWSKAVVDEVSPDRREQWEKYWVDYDELPENIKELDREWARRVLEEIENGNANKQINPWINAKEMYAKFNDFAKEQKMHIFTAKQKRQ